jgi:lipopolysaccharide assembly LptE-like protein
MTPLPALAPPRPPLAAALLALAACGYAVTTAGHGLQGGAARASVRPFENLSAEPELGAVVTTAVREQLARRGEGGEGAVIEGEVRSGEPVPSTPGGGPAGSAATWRIALEVRARLRVGDKVVAEKTVRREYDYLTGSDPLETEGRRAIALRRLAALAAEDVVRAFEG